MSVLRHLELLEKYLPINVIFFLLFQDQIIVCQLFKSKSEICCDGLNRNLCCCKGNNDYFSTLELYAMHDGKSHGKMHPITGHLCVFHNSCLRLNNNLENIGSISTHKMISLQGLRRGVKQRAKNPRSLGSVWSKMSTF